MYTETVMDHFRNPRNVGSIENADGVGQVGNPKCGDIMKIYLKIKDELIEDVKFETLSEFPCCYSSLLSHQGKGTIIIVIIYFTKQAQTCAIKDAREKHDNWNVLKYMM